MDDNVSFTIPVKYQKLDTAGQTVYMAEANDARMQIITIPQAEMIWRMIW